MRCLSDDALLLLSAGWTVVSSSPRLAATASRQFRDEQLAGKHGSWDRPAILSTGAWLRDVWRERRYRDASTPTLLSTAQELLLWQEVIQRDGVRPLDLAATARASRSASLALAQYEVPLRDGRWQTHHDAESFARWSTEMRRRCAAENWTTMASLWRLAPDWVLATKRGGVRLLLAGFQPMFPAMRRVIDAIEQNGGQVRRADLEAFHPVVQSKPCQSLDEEWEEAARWARQWVETGVRSVGVIVPGLAEQREKIARVFDDVFYPSHLVSGLNAMAEPQGLVNVEGSARLRDHPLVANAMLVLDLVADRIPVTRASAFLRSPFIEGADEERHLRAQADLELRRHRDLEVTLRGIELAAKSAPGALKLCRKIARHLSKKPAAAEFPHWSRFIAELLSMAGWPGKQLRPGEQQVFEAWQDALGQLGSLGLVSGPVSWPAALAQLRGLLNTRQPQATDSSCPVQILDPREAAGIHFDHLWITALSHENWEFHIESSPLIPRSLQRECAMPGASADVRRVEQAAALSALLGSAPDLVASFSGTPLPILAGSENQPTLPRWDSPLFKSLYRVTDCVTSIDDGQAPIPKTAQLSGGTGLIKAQSACPFSAFAKARLDARGPEDGAFGFDARERGGFVHRVFEAVWKQVQTQECLRETPAEELESIVTAAIATALGKRAPESEFQREITEAEALRLRALVLEWLEVDKSRLKPFRVIQIEEERSFELNGVSIRLRIDRVDQLDNGKLLLIDYKSGDPKRENLKGDRPKEPQLLVYAAALGEQVEGVCFAKVNSGETELIGFAKEQPASRSGVEVLGSAWAGQRDQWRETVGRLAEEFRSGHAVVDPGPKACEFCDFKPLCRINETRDSDAGDES
jgi:ATP-dependent helicase/nuclease subunit B